MLVLLGFGVVYLACASSRCCKTGGADAVLRRCASIVWRLGVKELRSLRDDPSVVFLIVYFFTFAVYSPAKDAPMELGQRVGRDRRRGSFRAVAAHRATRCCRPSSSRPASDRARRDRSAMDRGRYSFVIDDPAQLRGRRARRAHAGGPDRRGRHRHGPGRPRRRLHPEDRRARGRGAVRGGRGVDAPPSRSTCGAREVQSEPRCGVVPRRDADGQQHHACWRSCSPARR